MFVQSKMEGINMYGHTIYLDKEHTHGVKLTGINFNLLTKYHQGYFNESTREDILSGKLEIDIARNTRIQDYEFFGKAHVLPHYESREVSINNLPQEIQNKLIEIWADIEKELSNSKPLFIDAGKGR